MGNRFRVAALAATVGLACAASAQASVRVGVTVQVGVSATAPYIEGLLRGQTQPLDAAGNLVCEPGQTVGGHLPGGQPVSQALCAIPALDYQFVTRFKHAGGEVVRRHTALVNVPTPLNVDADPEADVVGTLQIISVSEVSLKIDRVLTEFAALPVKVEAIVDDPSAGGLPRENVNVGYDARESRAPSAWKATATMFRRDGETALNVVKDVVTSGTTISTLGGLFNGDALARRDPMGGEIAYTPVPTQATLGMTLGSFMEVRAGANAPVRVKARAEIAGGPREQRIGVDLLGLPRSARVRLEEPGTNERVVTYEAASGVPSLGATYSDSVGGTLATKVVARASGLPPGMVLRQTGARTATFEATGGTLGSVEVGYANGEPRLLTNATHPYALIFDDGTLKSYAGRIDALQSASVDATTKISAELQLGPDPRKPFRALVDMPGRHIDALVEDLPRHLKVLFDADGGIIDYNAFGETIDDITFDADQTTPFFGRVTRLHGSIAGLPTSNTINFRQSSGALTLAATNPIGTITLLASDGSDAPAVDGSYAWLEDTASRFRAFARISGLKAVSFAGDPVAGSIDTSSAQVLKLRGETGGVTFDSVIDKLPPHVGFTMTPGANGRQVIDYNTNGTEIDRITVDATGLPLPNGADKLHAEIEDLPGHMTLTLPASGGTIAFDPHGDHIGRVLAQAYGASGPAHAASGRQLLHYNEAKAQITIDVHNVGALSATQSTSPLAMSYDISSAPLHFGVEMSDGTYLNGTISNPQPATIFVDPSGGATAALYQVRPGGPNFRGNGEIDQIDISTNAAGGYLEGHLSNVPARLYVCVQSETGNRCRPTWVPLGAGGHDVPAADFAFQLQPADLNNQVPANRLTFNGRFCPDEPDPAWCSDTSRKNERVVIDDLKFNTVEVGFGHQDDDCRIACGRAWAGFNTESYHINGRVRYYDQGEDGPTVDFNAPDPDSFLAAQQLFFLVHYDIGGVHLETSSSGSLICGSPRPSAEIEIPGPNVDVLGGTFGVCP